MCNLEHLGLLIDTNRMAFTVPERKVYKVESAARKIMKILRSNRRQVNIAALRKFAGVC